jgi:hypothetical protein
VALDGCCIKKMLQVHLIERVKNSNLVRGAIVKMNRLLNKLVNLAFIKNLEFDEFDMQANIDGGIYRMYNADGEIIYVGKSSNLRTRIHNHLEHRTHTDYFIDEVVRVEYHTEPNPIYETLLESIFIAIHLPKYNDEVKDAKKKLGEDYGD